jgi:hypothetical protein
MENNLLPFEVFETIVETASLWLVPADESSDGDPDSVVLRQHYSGRGYVSGFAITVESETALWRFLVAAGAVAADADRDGGETFDADSLARSMNPDNMGRSGTIVCFHRWEITGVPEGTTCN